MTTPKAMLAKNYNPTKAKSPVWVSPKLDGLRALAVVHSADDVRFYSRGGNEIKSVEHIREHLISLQLPAGTILDGEIYRHGEDFNYLSGIARRQYWTEESRLLQYHVFDMVSELPWSQRQTRFYSLLLNSDPQLIQIVMQYVAITMEEVKELHDEFVENGFEGAMVRTQVFDKKTKQWSWLGYESGERSLQIQKVKMFRDDEGIIVGVEEEISKDGIPKGRTGKFVMQTQDGKEFRAAGITDDIKKDSWENPDQYIGKRATFKYLNLSEGGVPRHPNFKGLRPEGE